MPIVILNQTDNAFTQDINKREEYYDVTGSSGNDVIRIYSGSVDAQGGNDVIERLTGTSTKVELRYQFAPAGIKIDLTEGWAEDGYGTRDQLIGQFDNVWGSQRDDVVNGNSRDNWFYGTAGNDWFDGKGGIDSIWVAGFLDSSGAFRTALLKELNIQVSADGKTAVVTDPTGTGKYFRYNLVNVEYVTAPLNKEGTASGRIDLIAGYSQTGGENAPIRGSIGNDTIYGDGYSIIKSDIGDDTIYSKGDTIVLDPGNDKILIVEGINLNLTPDLAQSLSTRKFYYNFSTSPWSVDNKSISPRSLFDGYGGIDQYVVPSKDRSSPNVTVIGSPGGEYINFNDTAFQSLNFSIGNSVDGARNQPFGIDTILG